MNKKSILLLISIAFVIGLAGCKNADNGQGKAVIVETTRPEDIEYAWQKVINAKDSFSNCGFTHFVADETCMYTFEAYGDNDLTWDIYVLDYEWQDADRYIPQANKIALSTDGRLMIEEGKYVYIQCPHNDFTSDAPLKKDFLKIYK